MTAGKDLFQLISSLSSNEKRYFTQKSSNQKKELLYVRIFEILTKLGEYDREEILSRLGRKYNVSHLSVAENYLYTKLMSSLREFHTTQNIVAQINDLFFEAQILYNRGLYQMALKRIEKAEKLAFKYQKTVILLDIIPFKANIILGIKAKNVRKTVDATYQKVQNVLVSLQQEMDYRYLNSALVALYRTTPFYPVNQGTDLLPVSLKKEYEKMIAQDVTKLESFDALYYYYSIQAFYAVLNNDYQKAVGLQKKVVSLWSEHPNLIKENIERYISQLANYIAYLIRCEYYEAAFEQIKMLENLEAYNKNIKGELFQNIYFYKLQIYLNTQNYVKAKELIPEIENGLNTYNDKISISRRLAFLYHIGLTFWLMRDYLQALTWFEKIPNSNRFNEYKPDIVRGAHLLKLAIFYEINSDNSVELIGNKIRAIKRREMSSFEEILIHFFSKLNNCLRYSKEEQAIFTDFQIALNKLEGQQITAYEAYCDWVDYRCRIK